MMNHLIKISTHMTFFSVEISREQKEKAWKYAKDNNFAYRGDHSDGSLAQKFTGFLGEIVLADLLNQEWPNSKGFDHGVDFEVAGVRIDLKTQARNYDFKDYYSCNLMGSQVHSSEYHNDVYLFSNINKKTNKIQFVGWVTKLEARLEKVWKDGEERERSDGSRFKVRGSLVEIPAKKLRPFENPHSFAMKVGGAIHPGF